MEIKQYKNGLTVMVETMPSLRSVACGIMVATGSCNETRETNGISQFIEHVNFKGTEKRTAQDIVSEFDRMGASFNAFTGKEYTCYYFKSIDETFEPCFDILSDIFLHSKYDGEELDRERKVIIAEINMSKDDPDGVCTDVLYATAYRDAPLGMDILGPKSNVERFGKSDILDYKKHNYLPTNTAVAFVGNITLDGALALVEKHMGELVNAPRVERKKQQPSIYFPGYGEYIHDYEQSEISIAFPSFPYSSEYTEALVAVDCLFGSGMSSRLFQRLREKMGLVYSVYTQAWGGINDGLFSICANVNVENVPKAVEAIKNEVDILVKNGVTADETQKAITQLKVSAYFSREASRDYMLGKLRQWTKIGRVRELDETIARIEALTPAKINDVVQSVFTKPTAIAYVGKAPTERVDKIFGRK